MAGAASRSSTMKRGGDGPLTGRKRPREPNLRVEVLLAEALSLRKAGGKVGELWTKRHAPKSASELAVDPKRLQALRSFLANPGPSSLLLLTGPPGAGKSTAVRVITAEVDVDVIEWEAPVPTSWSELQHQTLTMTDHYYTVKGDLRLPYVSKIDAFDRFVSDTKFLPLGLCEVGRTNSQPDSKAPRGHVVVVEDLPIGAESALRQNQLLESLERLVQTSAHPVILMWTTPTSAGGQDASPPILAKLSELAARVGGKELAFNPITAIRAAKALGVIATAERVSVEEAELRCIGEACGGDLAGAVETLQLFCCGRPRSSVKLKPARKPRKKAASTQQPRKVGLDALHRDSHLSSFHALGKLLYNKRCEDASPPHTQQRASCLRHMSSGVSISERHQRLPAQEDAENVLDTSKMDPSAAAAFLQENVPHFIHEQAIEDLATTLDYLSSADCLLSHRPGLWPATGAGGNVVESCGASTAARGVMWANAHPAERRFLALRGSMWWPIAQARTLNASELLKIVHTGRAARWGIRMAAAEVLPFLRVMYSAPAAGWRQQLLPARWAHVRDRQVVVEARPPLADCGLDTAAASDLEDDPIVDD